MTTQTSADRIRDDIAHHVKRALFVAKMLVKVTFLPKLQLQHLPRGISRALTEDVDESSRIGRCGRARDKKVQMIGHIAVGNIFNAPFGGRVRKLPMYEIDDIWTDEVARTIERAHREEDTDAAAILLIG